MGRSSMASLKQALFPLALLALISMVAAKPKHLLVETKNKGSYSDDYSYPPPAYPPPSYPPPPPPAYPPPPTPSTITTPLQPTLHPPTLHPLLQPTLHLRPTPSTESRCTLPYQAPIHREPVSKLYCITIFRTNFPVTFFQTLIIKL